MFAKLLLAWFDAHGRKTLPWQINKSPYRVWISEIMLQQTQVATVIPFYERFMQRFPSVEALANAKEDEVLHLWAGLGYYSRARNLHRAAQIIIRDCQGVFPSAFEEIIKLPGIGKSTAGAILAIAFGQKSTILDGNVQRVLSRFEGILQWPGERKISEKLWEIASKRTSATRPGDYTQAIMDLGATVCVRSKPLCQACPFTAYCIAYTKNLQHVIPAKKSKKTLPIRESIFLVLRHKNFIFLEKRPSIGIWGGLWSLPQCSISEIENYLKKYGFKALTTHEGEPFRHTFSHFHLDISPVFIAIEKKPRKIFDDETLWYDLSSPPKIGLPAPVTKILELTK